MTTEKLTSIPHSFQTSSRLDLVLTLRQICSDPKICDVMNRSQSELARQLGISESTWKRARGVGGDWHKVDIYYLLKFIALYSNCNGLALVLPAHNVSTQPDRNLTSTCSQVEKINLCYQPIRRQLTCLLK